MADDSNSSRNDGFTAALLATDLHASVPAEMDLFGPLLGSWQADAKQWHDDGRLEQLTIDIEFVRVLQGRAIQDTWLWWRANPQSGERERVGGSTLRVYDPDERVWRVTWIYPAQRTHVQLTARAENGLQLGADANGEPRRWIISDITARGFTWRGEKSLDGGRTWRLYGDYRARRIDSR